MNETELMALPVPGGVHGDAKGADQTCGLVLEFVLQNPIRQRPGVWRHPQLPPLPYFGHHPA